MGTDDPDILTHRRAVPRAKAMTEAPTFAESLALAQRGAGAGFDDLYRRTAGRIKGFAISRGATDPDGITADVLVKMFRSIGDFAGDERDFAAWGFAIARNQLIDAHRSRRRRPEIEDRAVPELTMRSAEAEALDGLGNERVQRMLDELTPDQRDVITMRIIADLSLEQTAYAMDKTVTAVKRLQARALKQLRRKLSDEAVS